MTTKERNSEWAGERIRKRFGREISVSTLAIIENYIAQVEEAADDRGFERGQKTEKKMLSLSYR